MCSRLSIETMELHRSAETQLHAIERFLPQQTDASTVPVRIYKDSAKALSIRCYGPGIVAMKHEWSKTAKENSKKYYLHIYEERGPQFIEGQDEASCRAGTRYRIAVIPDLWQFRDVWRWLKQVDLREGAGEEANSFGYENDVKDLEDKEKEMKKVAERLARQRTKVDVAARNRGETVGPYFSIHKHRAEYAESKTALGEKKSIRGSEQGLKESRDVEARGRDVLPQGHNPIAAPALASPNQGMWMNSKHGGGACGGGSGILTPVGYYNKWGRQTLVSQALAGYSFPGIAR